MGGFLSTLRAGLKQAAAQPRPLRFVVGRVLRRTGLCRLIIIQRDGYRLRFQPTGLSANLWAVPETWAEQDRFYRTFLRPGETCVDVGANIGRDTFEAAMAVGREGHVYSFEPHPTTFEYLRANLALNDLPQVELFRVAAGAGAGRVTMTSLASDVQNYVEQADTGDTEQASLDELLLHRVDRVALMKVDVEGYERFVFAGAAGLLRRTLALFFEVGDKHFERFGYTTPELVAQVRALGLDVYHIEDGPMEPVAADFTCWKPRNLLATADLPAVLERLGRDR